MTNVQKTELQWFLRMCRLRIPLRGTDWVTLIPFEGIHEFCKDNAPIEALVRYISEL